MFLVLGLVCLHPIVVQSCYSKDQSGVTRAHQPHSFISLAPFRALHSTPLFSNILQFIRLVKYWCLKKRKKKKRKKKKSSLNIARFAENIAKISGLLTDNFLFITHPGTINNVVKIVIFLICI